jgi:hypothetical protein
MAQMQRPQLVYTELEDTRSLSSRASTGSLDKVGYIQKI